MVYDGASDPGGAGPSLSSNAKHSYQLRSRIRRPPNGFMLFAQEKRRRVATESRTENNQRLSSRMGSMWCTLNSTDKEPYQRKVSKAAAVYQRKHPEYVYNWHEPIRRKEHKYRAQEIASMLENYGYGEQKERSNTVELQSSRHPGVPAATAYAAVRCQQ
ncbi:transcription factor Sox-1a-like [Dermacentor variabilis]|uniref:transcription factor Sox-1a-like n=1 Tax=Dermacentor variabilis TaxID=34621 RepID=UPI003F5B8FDA